MKTFFKKHIDQTLIAIAIILVAAIAGFFAWSFTDLGVQINRIIGFTPTPAEGTSFDLKAAAALDLKGLVAASSSNSSSTP